MKLVFTGDSHSHPLSAAARRFLAENDLEKKIGIAGNPLGSQRWLCEPFFRPTETGVVIVHEKMNACGQEIPLEKDIAEESIYVLTVGFNTHHFVWTTKEFSHLRTHVDEKWALSTAVFDASFDQIQQHQMAFVRQLNKARLKFVVVEAPSLFLNTSLVGSANLGTVAWVNTRVRALFAQFLEAEKIPCVRLRPEMLDSDGFMVPAYRHERQDDEHHAGVRWGLELMPDILDAARALRQAPTR